MPGIPFPPSAGAAPRYKTVVGTDQAANTEVSDAVPAGKWWWVIAVTVQMVQGATQTPLPALQFDDGTNTFGFYPGSTTAMTAATTAQFSWAIDGPLTGLIGTSPAIQSVGPLGNYIILPPGGHIKNLTAGLGANSNYGAPIYYVCEFSI